MIPVTNNCTARNASLKHEYRCNNLYSNFEQRVACVPAVCDKKIYVPDDG